MSRRTYWAEHDPRNRYRTIHTVSEGQPLCGTPMFRLYRVKKKELGDSDLGCGSCAFAAQELESIMTFMYHGKVGTDPNEGV